MNPKMILHSNAPWSPTGYGQQTALFAPSLKDRYNLAISAFYGLEGNVLPWNGIPVLPGIAGTHGNETILAHVDKLFDNRRDGLVFTLMDVWVLDPAVWRQLNTVCWAPVDHDPLSEPVRSFFDASGAVPMAMSRFGVDQLQQAGFDPLYVPHAVDCQMLQPVPKPKARAATGMPQDAFVVGMVAANKGNPSRKCFAEAFQAFKALHDLHPDAKLYLHTEVTGMFEGVNLPALIKAVGISSDDVLFCDQYRAVHFPFGVDTMKDVYSSLDVLLAPSAAEGFGIPVVEAQACGVPVVVSNFSAQPELVGAGWTVEGTSVFSAHNSWQFRPDVDDIVDALRRAYSQSVAGREAMAAKARTFAEGYDLPVVLEAHMLPALEEARQRFGRREPTKIKPKRSRQKVAA